MKRWGFLVAILYGAILCVLLPPTYHLAFAGQPRSAIHGMFFQQWWLLLAAMALGQGALLAVPVRGSRRYPRLSPRPWTDLPEKDCHPSSTGPAFVARHPEQPWTLLPEKRCSTFTTNLGVRGYS